MTVCTKTVQALPSGAAAARVPVFGVVGADGHTARVEVAGILVRQRVRYSLHPVRGGILYLRLKQRLNDLRPGRSAAPHGGAHRGNALHLMAVFDSWGISTPSPTPSGSGAAILKSNEYVRCLERVERF